MIRVTLATLLSVSLCACNSLADEEKAIAPTGASSVSLAGAAEQTNTPYSDAEKWLCLPGRMDTCDQDLTTTVVSADGSMEIEAFDPPADPPVDCFYVYPTLSLDKGANADWIEGPEEGRVVHQQLARFADVCRVYAPKYRQITMLGASGALPRDTVVAAFQTAYRDVADAWACSISREGHRLDAGFLRSFREPSRRSRPCVRARTRGEVLERYPSWRSDASGQ